MGKITRAWTRYKSDLKKEFIDRKNPLGKSLPYECGKCTKEEWDTFVANVSTEEHQVK